MTPIQKLTQLRSILKQQNLDGFIIQRGDEFLNEYVAPYAERLSWLTGFTGSAGIAVILENKAAVFSDGRYILQMQQELDETCWKNFHISKHRPSQWIAEQNANITRVGYDPKLMSERDLKAFEHSLITMVPIPQNLIDAIWIDQPTPPNKPITPHEERFSGQDHQEKINNLQQELIKNQQNAFILCDPASICWLLNIRGSDVPYTPIPLVFAIIKQDHVFLYAEPSQYTEGLSEFLGDHILLKSHKELEKDLAGFSNKAIALDPIQTPVWFIQTLEQYNVTINKRTNPCIALKACKNKTEQDGARQAHIRDAVAMCRFLYWLEKYGIGQSEVEVASKLNAFRQESGDIFYKEESFPAISGVGANGAIIHYHATPENCSILKENQTYLIDSGGQYLDGTTDITRTIWLGNNIAPMSVKEATTRVLQGHIAISAAVFPQGTTGSRLDVLARYALWQQGLDYDHGTGHGVGSYLSVHEGPCRISSIPFPVPLEAGMIISNEPGYYLSGQYGIRLENLLLVTTASFDNFLQFEPLTLVPFDLNLIATEHLSPTEKNWLNQYHQKVHKTISPYLDIEEQQWLQSACAPVT
ncbi:aminopeptidase P family protein [Commensalibacter papalotli (ex Servin-Garciduenas et al. 2014)]|uniref:Peptidase M24 n=1 Tax=Commensalibacter papalotli (ex Servin-Garciduenas et al. 2014) TaxID=1208583 RepID=W7DNJ2_9PROT|nr:aminopeptidase P family protein [Commensalibacter papalotli (ex Servin-Garciduenas et al. 2014)]EUK18852.1 peptidase M24 [Commensalibacter papalotli (ex Servin-Garciduenas et al. 2014)]